MFLVQPIQAQNYRISTYPDLWYNDTDGIRLGLRFLGEVEGTFKDGPHRLDAGIWVGSKFPENPVSYYFSFTEPIPVISDFGSEGNIQFISSIRTGYSMHQLRLNKRWQQEFDDLDYTELSFFGSYEKNVDSSYRFDPGGWSDTWKTLVGLDGVFSRDFDQFRTHNSAQFLRELDQGFNSIQFQSVNRIKLSDGVHLRTRFYFHQADANSYNEYFGYLWTNAPAFWLQNGFKRASGTIPDSWLTDGFFHFSGGPNLRGYSDHAINGFERSVYTQYQTVYGVNFEFVYPNPIDKVLNKNEIIGDLVEFQSYLFFDAGGGENEVQKQVPVSAQNEGMIFETGTITDAGLGFQFSVNIPDYLGKDRGIFIRYDIPFWISAPSNNESNFKLRNVIGIGAIFNF